MPAGPRPSRVAEFLGAKRALLVLDNMEQVVEAGPDLVALLAAAPSTAILVASREPLAVDGEHIYPVPPLAVPAEPGVLRAADIADREAVILFVERARAARPAFALTDANAPPSRRLRAGSTASRSRSSSRPRG